MTKNQGRSLVLVTGGTGALGPTLVRELAGAGYPVRVLVRPGSDTSRLPENLEYISGDLKDQKALQQAVRGAEYVFHLAAKLHINKPDPSLEGEYWQVNVAGTQDLVRAASDAGVSRLIFFSSINVYGESGEGEIFDESSLADPQSLYARTKLEAEGIVLDAKRKGDAASLGVVLRLGAVYGPGMKGNYLRLLQGLSQGWFLPIGSSQNRRSLINVEDLVNAAALAAQHPDAPGKIYNLTDGNIYTLGEIISAMCQALDRKPPQIHLPLKPIRWGVGLLEDLCQLLRLRAPIGRLTLEKMTEDRAVSGDKIQRELGFSPRIELVEGWRRVVDHVFVKD